MPSLLTHCIIFLPRLLFTDRDMRYNRSDPDNSIHKLHCSVPWREITLSHMKSHVFCVEKYDFSYIAYILGKRIKSRASLNTRVNFGEIGKVISFRTETRLPRLLLREIIGALLFTFASAPLKRCFSYCRIHPLLSRLQSVLIIDSFAFSLTSSFFLLFTTGNT